MVKFSSVLRLTVNSSELFVLCKLISEVSQHVRAAGGCSSNHFTQLNVVKQSGEMERRRGYKRLAFRSPLPPIYTEYMYVKCVKTYATVLTVKKPRSS